MFQDFNLLGGSNGGRIVAAIFPVFLLLSSCAQQTKFSYKLCADEATVCELAFDDGKGRKYVHVTVAKGSTKLDYTATDVDASARAAIVSEAVKEVLPDIVAAAIKAAKVGAP